MSATDHAEPEHQEMAVAVNAAMEDEIGRDPKLCGHCMRVGHLVASIVALRLHVEHLPEDDDRNYWQEQLDELVRQRLVIGSHKATVSQ